MAVISKKILFLCTDWDGFDILFPRISDEFLSKGNEFEFAALFDRKSTKTLYEVKFKKHGIDSYLLSDYWNDKIDINSALSKSLLDYFIVDFDRLEYYNQLPVNKSSIAEALHKQHRGVYSFISKYSPYLIISEGPFNTFTRIAHEVAENKNILVMSLKGGRMAGTSYVANHDGVTALSTGLSCSDKFGCVIGNLEYMTQSSPLIRGLKWKILNFRKSTFLRRTLPQLLNAHLDSSELKYLPQYPRSALKFVASMWLNELLRPIKRKISERYFHSLDFGLNNYIVYPEHFHPEASTSADDFIFRDDVQNVINIRKILPDDVQVLYRIHPSNHGRRSLADIKKISAIPGIYIASPDYSLYSLLKNSKAVISVNSTMIMDAARLGVPSFVLGHFEAMPALKGIAFPTSLDSLSADFFYHINEQRKSIDVDWLSSHYLPAYLWSDEFPELFYNLVVYTDMVNQPCS